jgi:hypothetical protein
MPVITTLAKYLVAGSLLGVVPLSVMAEDPSWARDFARTQALIKPRPSEDKWSQIPWRTSLWQARRQAASEGKPILLWEMDGHPLGCT